MEKFNELVELVESLKGDVNKFYKKGVKAAAVRVTKGMQDIKKLAQEVRVDVFETKKK